MTRGTTTDASASPSVTSGPAKAIRLVYCDESGKFQMDPEAVSVLKLIKEPIGVVSVCGCARQGKSYILNQLLGRSSGFQVASTHRPCTKGLWLWSTPIRRTALDGTEYNLLLIDSEGIDAYDQTGPYSTQIFPLAVLLSSMFIYNQMGGIDEAAIDRLSFVAEMTKHIRVRASTTPSELGQFSPTFVWLLRDFYLDLVEDNRKITPRDYLELALRPVQGGGSAKNEIRESIRGLFPDRDCFTLVRPLSNENDLQRLDQISMDQLRPEFKTGLDALTRYVFERTRPKQVGATVMTGPIFAGITKSFLDALNNGAVPTIASAWQSVEETECQRALEYASEVYKSSFDSTKPPEEATIREAHEEAVQKALAAFNSMAVGAGPVRQRCEKSLHTFFRKELEDYKREAFLICTNAVQKMEKELRTACQAPGAKFDDILKVLDHLLSSYEATSYGPEKWQKLASFLRQSLEGPVVDFVKRNSSSLDDRYSNLSKAFEAAKHESLEWKRKYEVEVANLKARSSAAEARLAAAREQTLSAQEEADEWKRRYDVAVKEAKSKQTQHREYALPAEFEGTLAEKGDLHMKNYKLHELRAIAKKRKIPRYTKYRKLELAQMLETDSVAVKETSGSKPKMQHGMIQSTTTWFDLSLDLKMDILCSVVSIEKLGNVQKVCRDWRKICEDPSMWRVIYMDSEFCSDCRPYHWPSSLPRDEITARRMCRNAVDRSQGQLVDITMIGFCDDELLEYVADRSPKLIHLEIVYPEYSAGSLIKALKKLPKLEELSLYYADESQVDQALGSYCPELKTLRLNHTTIRIGDAEIIAISQNLRELRHLEIHANIKLSNTGVQAILDGCPCLKVLDLRLCVLVDLKGDIGKRLEQIESVLYILSLFTIILILRVDVLWT